MESKESIKWTISSKTEILVKCPLITTVVEIHESKYLKIVQNNTIIYLATEHNILQGAAFVTVLVSDFTIFLCQSATECWKILPPFPIGEGLYAAWFTPYALNRPFLCWKSSLFSMKRIPLQSSFSNKKVIYV